MRQEDVRVAKKAALAVPELTGRGPHVSPRASCCVWSSRGGRDSCPYSTFWVYFVYPLSKGVYQKSEFAGRLGACLQCPFVGIPPPPLFRDVDLTMAQVLEINRIDELTAFRQNWDDLLDRTRGASFFQSLPWLEVYWRHFGAGQRLRTLVVLDEGQPVGILPLVVRREKTKVGWLRILTLPLHDWGSFYGPVGPNPALTLIAGLKHIRCTQRDWDILDLRWQGAVDTDPDDIQRAMLTTGFQAYPTEWERTAIVDLDGTWESYWASRKGAWLRRFRRAERKLSEQGDVTYVRYRPTGAIHDDGSPRWDLYDTCEEIARRSWQNTAENGTTLSDAEVRGFFREAHEVAATAGAVDLSLLLLDGRPVAFIYGYHYHGYAYGLRRGYDPERTRQGAGNVLLAYTLRDCFARGDHVYDLGVGSPESKRHFQTRVIPVLRFSHFPPSALRAQAMRVKRWWQGRRLPVFTAVGRVQDGVTDPR